MDGSGDSNDTNENAAAPVGDVDGIPQADEIEPMEEVGGGDDFLPAGGQLEDDGIEDMDHDSASEDDEEDEESSDEDLPDLGFDEINAGGGEVILVHPAQLQHMVNEPQMEAIDAPMEVDGLIEPFRNANDGELKKILSCLCSTLNFTERKRLRWLSSRINNMLVAETELFQKDSKAKISTLFYKNASRVNSQIAIRPNEVTFQNFLFYRRHEFFKIHWQQTATKLETLEITDCSLECEGFKFIVDFAPNIKTLNLNNCKLRDLDDVHLKPRAIPVTTVEVPEHRGINYLHLQGMTIIEICFMQYLAEKIKPNCLIELTMSKCFIDDIKAPAGTHSADRYFKFFAPLFVKIISNNAQSLKVLTFKENPFQMMIFQKLAEDSEVLQFLQPTHLTVSLLPPQVAEESWNPFLQFLTKRCSKLTNLDLEIVNDDNGENLRNIVDTLTASKCPLKSFYFKFNGNAKAIKVQLDGFLTESKELEQLVLVDKKELDPDVKYIVGGDRFYRYRLHGSHGYTPAHSERLVAKSLTNIATTFLAQLPPKLTKLCLDHFIPETNMWLESLNNPICLESFKKLTKLEIRGPYIHTLHFAIPQILTLVNLETLALTNCDIQDTYITGLGYEAIMDLRRCLLYGLSLIDTKEKTVEDLDKAIREAPHYKFKTETVCTLKPKLSDLKKLKHLDLSSNPQISDFGIYDSLRLPLVETLKLNDCSRVTDNGLYLIGLNFPALKLLSVKYCRKMSEFGINELLKTCKNLQRVHTTRVVTKRKINGFIYEKCPQYNDIVRTTIATQSEGFILDDIDSN